MSRLTRQVLGQLRTQPGFLGGQLLLDRKGAAWTLTGWVDTTSLDMFREAHAPVASRVHDVAIDSASTAWVADDLPTWQEVGSRWTSVPAPGVGFRATVPPAAASLPSLTS